MTQQQPPAVASAVTKALKCVFMSMELFTWNFAIVSSGTVSEREEMVEEEDLLLNSAL